MDAATLYYEVPAGLAVLSADLRLHSVNRAFATMLGRKAASLEGRDIRSLMPAGDPDFRISAKSACEHRLMHRTGSVVRVEVRIERIRKLPGGAPLYLAVFQDVTVRRETEDRTRGLEERFRLLVEASPMGVIQAHRDGRLIRANKAFYAMVGWSAEEFERTGQSMRTITPPEWLAHSEAHIDSTAELSGAVMYEKEYARRDGTSVPVAVALSRDLSNSDVLLAFIFDLSAQKEAEAKLRAGEQKLMFAQKAAGAGMYDIDLRTGHLHWTAENYSLFGLSPGAGVTTALWKSMVDEQDRERVSAARDAAVETRSPLELEYRIVRADGARRWISTSAGVLCDERRRPARLVGLNFDITDRKVAENAVRDSEMRIRRMADAMPQIVWTSKPDLSITYYNRRWYEYTGTEAAGAGEGDWRPVIHPADMPLCIRMSQNALADGKPYELECRIRGADGAYRWHLVRSVPLRDRAGEIYEWVGTSTNIDDRKRWGDRLEQGVSKRTAELRRSLADKEILLKEVQHRVKNNLQVMCSLMGLQIECAREAGHPAPAIALLLEAQNRVHAMALIHQQLYQTANMPALDFAGYVQPLAQQLFDVYGVSRRRVRLNCSAEPIQLNMVQAIASGLILNELLSNVLKHAFGGGEGDVTVAFARDRTSRRLRLTVADNGAGMPEGFNAGDGKSLGMQIVNAMCLQLCGRVEVSGPPGTTVTVEWPEEAGQRG